MLTEEFTNQDLTVQQAARFSGCSERLIRDAAKSGKVPHIRRDGRIFVTIGDLLAFRKPKLRFLLVGGGDMFRLLTPAMLKLAEAGVKVFVANQGKIDKNSPLRAVAKTFDLSGEREFRRLVAAGPFDLGWLAIPPDFVLPTALRFDSVVQRFVMPFRVDLDLTLGTKLRSSGAFDAVFQKTRVFEYYRVKAEVRTLKEEIHKVHLPRHGALRSCRINIVETITGSSEETQRRAFLRRGALMDLFPHALSALLELLSEQSDWVAHDGTYTRVGARVDLVECMRGRNDLSILEEGVETFAAVRLRVTEDITVKRPRAGKVVSEQRKIDCLIVVKKDVSREVSNRKPESLENDKAIELIFIDGKLITTPIPSQMTAGKSQAPVADALLRLADRRFNFTLGPEEGTSVQDFLSFESAWQVFTTSNQAREIAGRSKLIRYEFGTPSAILLQRYFQNA